MTAQHAIVDAALAADVPVLLWGPPGTGKTATLLAMAERANAHAEVLIGSTIDPTDVGGWLVPTKAGLTAYPPPWASAIREALDSGTQAWLVLDELSSAPPSVQASLLRVVHERRVGALSIAGCRVVAAANRAEHAADGGLLAAASSNRWAHVDWTVSPASWAAGLLGNWGKPVPDGWAKVAGSIAAFVTRNPSALLAPPTGDASGAWPSPRSWTMATQMLSVVAREHRVSVVASAVGSAAAAEWATWAAAGDLPDPEELLSGKAEWPERGDQRLASALSVVAAAVAEHKNRGQRIGQAAMLLSKLRPDVAIPAAAALVEVTDTVPDSLMSLASQIQKARGRLA